MNETEIRQNPAELKPQRRENVMLGILGAFLFSLVGAVAYFLLYQLDYIASISGIAAVFAANFGYGLFSGKKNSMKGTVISIIMAVVAILIAEYFSLAYEAYDAFKELGAPLSFGKCCASVSYFLRGYVVQNIVAGEPIWFDAGSKEVLTSALRNVGLTLLFCAVGTYYFVRGNLAKIKEEKAAQQQDHPAEF